MNSNLSDYDYPLLEELIAKRPLADRASSRMMVLHRNSEKIEHRRFFDLKEFLQDGDLVVLNDTRVLPARRFSDDGRIDFLFLEKLGSSRWKCLVKPGRKMRAGTTATIENVSLRVEQILPEGERIIAFERDIDPYASGAMPLPPYIDRESDATDDERYQTIYAQTPGALAAPTAGLHFTPELLQTIPHAFITLHVGIGTFRPVKSEDITEHRMEPERFSISAEAADQINRANRIIAIGTTTVRVLEFAARELDRLKRSSSDWELREISGETNLFIYPPFDFRMVDALLTNFHLPRSTLLMLVSAFAGREFILRAYEEAIRERYRFYSYGDCMLIL